MHECWLSFILYVRFIKQIVPIHILVYLCTCRKFYSRLSLSYTKQKDVSTLFTKHKIQINRSSRLEEFRRKGVLRNFAKFTGIHLYQGLFFNKVTGLKSVTSLKKRLWNRSFHVNFAKILWTPFLTENLLWLLLNY